MMKYFLIFACINLHTRIIRAGIIKETPQELMYANITIYESGEKYFLTYDVVPLKQSQLEKYTKEMEKVEMERQGAFFVTTPSPFPFSVEALLKSLPAMGIEASKAVNSIFGQLGRNILGINISHAQSNPNQSSSKAINNVALCNPIFLGINSTRCKGILQAA